MRSRPFIWILLCLLCLSGAWLLWPRPANTRTKPSALQKVAVPTVTTVRSASTAPNILATASTNAATSAKTNQFAYRLSNTGKTIGQLVGDRHAILLENALIDTGSPLTFSIPAHLRSQGDPGAYIVQARGPIDNAFRAMLASAGATIVSYIPNDAYLVRAPVGVANGLAGSPLTQAVTPYEPYYKIQSSLLIPAIGQMDLPAGAALNLGLFADTAGQTIQEIEKLGGTVLAQDRSPFGPVIRVRPPQNWTVLATLPGVQIVEAYHPRVHANDLSRAMVGVAADTQVSSNYLGLTGANVIVAVNDSGIDATHPDLAGRVFGSPTTDTSGHGTHVAGIIAGDGTESTTVTNAPGSIMPATNGQFRGMAPLANLLSMDWNASDRELQEAAARTNALISNNGWNNGNSAYDLAAASYDAAVRDALPLVTGSQPVLFVFAAGNAGNGDDTTDPGSGTPDTILSPATAKNVITVGAIQEFRDITNQVTTISADGTTTNLSTPWQPETSTSYRVAGFSSRGNVGIGTEGTYGRFKPDVVAPGTFVVSTRSRQWDIANYFYINPTNFNVQDFSVVVQANSLGAGQFPLVPNNTVQVTIQLFPNATSPDPFPDLPIYFGLVGSPTYPYVTTNNQVSIPPDGGLTIPDILSSEAFYGFNFAISNITSEPINFDIVLDTITTNNPGDYFLVLSNLNQSIGTPNPSSTGPGPYYRYETGTSMSAADVSGVLALMQDYFTNTLHATPSPALLKAMVINGARATGFYNFHPQNAINYEGWGLINLPNSLPPGITTNVNNGTGEAMLLVDQNPALALATGDSHKYQVTIANTNALALPLRITLAWTDPPGDPAAAIKLVNDLNLVVTNLDDPANPLVYYGNDIPASSTFNSAQNGTNTPNYDAINNVENVYLQPGSGTNFSVTVLGYRVNVNAVTAHTNNVVQDYALVISCGEGEVTNAFTVTDSGITNNPTSGQQITFVMTNNMPLLNQLAGASSPLLGTNNLPVGTNTTWGSNGVVTLGMTNQWHFYVVTNTGASDFTNAAFITFIPSTLAIPRTGVFADSTADATRPEADIDLYVAGPNDPNASSLTNLDLTVISNCLAGINGDAASLSRGGTEFVVYTNSAPGQVYYVGVYSEDREASEYGFIPIFTATPFSQMNPNGSQIVNGLNVPVNIPDGSPAHPGIGYVFAVALYPMEMNRVVVTNIVTHQNYGDLIGTLRHGNSSGASQSIVLNNHDSLFNPLEIYTHIYDDSRRGDIVGSQPSDGPGSLNNFVGQQGVGVWMLTEVDDSLTQTGSVTGFNLLIEPHQDLTKGITVTLEAGTWFYDFIDVPAGFTNLSIFATNLPSPSTPPLQLYLNYGVQPDFSNYLSFVLLTNGVTTPGNSISYGPPLLPGRYFVGLFNPDTVPHDVYLLSTLGGFASAIPPVDYSTNNGPILLDDAVSSSTIFISSTQQIASLNVGFVVEHPRISDLTFTLVSPTGQRILLMENRGVTTTNGAGDVFITTNSIPTVTSQGGSEANTNFINVGQTAGELTITYNFFGIPDQMTVYYSTNIIPANLILDTGFTNNPGDVPRTVTVNFGPGPSTYVTIIMNQFGNTNGPPGYDAWTYTAGGVQTNFNYLAFTEDTNLATIPIKFAIPPYDLADFGTNYILSDFELATNGNYFAPTNIFDDRGGWNLVSNQVVMMGTNLVILTNQVSVVTDPANAQGGSNFLALASGTISRVIPMTPGRQFNLTYMYRGPGISAWWRGEGNATDSADPETNGNNGELIGRFNFPAGEVGQAFQFEDAGAEFQFAGTNTYVQIRQPPFLIQVNPNGGSDTNLVTVQSSALDVGTGSGFTVEGWINPTNVSFQQPLVEWLARVPTNVAVTNLVIEAGPFLDRATGHYYYLLGSTNWSTSEFWATQLGGHLATIETANEENWVYDAFANYGGTNRNLWIGLTNDPANPTTPFAWSGGQTNVAYTNWVAGGPTNCSGNEFYTAILGPTNAFPGLWVLENNSGTGNNGVTCGVSPTNRIYGVVEVEEIQTNGVQLWISVTNSPGTTNLLVSSNGCLYANLVDITNGSHEIYSAPGLIQSNVYQHVALTYSTNSGLAALYYNGTNVATTNLGVFTPKTTGDVLLGRDMSRATNNFYGGKMDEMSIYGRCLSASEIAAIYNISALTTNRNIGKFDPSITPALSLAEARVSLGGLTNIILGANNHWQMQSFTFIATTNSLPLQITGIEPGMLLDSFSVAEAPLGNLYYLPEQSLDSLIGTSAHGTWTLQIWDNRVGAVLTNSLLSWQLQIVLQTNSLPVISLSPQDATTITVPPGLIVYLTVEVPSWANFATNILVSATAPVDLLFNQTNPPAGSNPNDFTLLTASTGGIGLPVLNTIGSTPPLLPGQTYYLGVRNSGAHAVTAVVRVDFDITALSNGVPVTGVLNTNDLERYFVFNVSSNAYEATFQLLQLSGNADLVVRKGTPLPTLLSSDYGSFNAGNVDENIYVFTNSSPVALSPGLWYLGVFKRDFGPVTYSVLAKELDLGASTPTIIDLTNNVPFNFTAGPGAALTNFFRFTVTNFPPAIRFELYNLSGNGDLTVQTNAPPFGPPFFQTSQQPGTSPELVFIATNSALSSLTNSALTNLNAQWYLGVPNRETNLITYTIVAVLDTNGYLPAFPGAAGAGGGAAGGGGGAAGGGHGTNGTVYHVSNLNDSGPGSLRDAVSVTNRTVVFDVSGTIKLLSPLVITNSYLTIAGQTAPGDGITVAGQMTTVQSAHDVVIRYLRFRPGGAAANVGVVWSNGFEGSGNAVIGIGSYFAGGWHVDAGEIDMIAPPSFGTNNTAYEGTNYIDLDGFNPGTISTNITTVPGKNYTLTFAYAQNPEGKRYGHPTALMQVLQNVNSLLSLSVTQTNEWLNLGWTTTSVVFTATASITTLSFHSLDPGGDKFGVLLDAVSLTTNVAATAGDSLQFTNVMDVIADHISTSWSANNLVSVLGSSNVTVQWSIMADSLHGFGSLLRYGNGALSFNHNLYANNYSANPYLDDNLSLDFVDNVIYNWGIHSGYSGTNDLLANPNGLTNRLNYACNYLIAGPDTAIYSTNAAQTNIAFWGGTTNTWIFQTNNFIDSDTNRILNGANTGWGMFTNEYTQFGRPFPLPQVPTDEAFIAYERVLDFAGTSLFARDSVDTNIVNGVRTQTGTIISTSGTLPALNSFPPWLDSDQDGIPDFWEITFGQNPTNASNNQLSMNVNYIGYTDLEEYLGWLAAPHALTITNTPVGVDLMQLFGKTGNLSFSVTNGIHGFVYLTNVLGSVTNTGPFSNSIAIFTPTNLPFTTNYSGYASFDVIVTNNDTVAYFGPVTVSVVVSAVPIAINSNMPSVITEPATNITATSATLEALVNPNGAATTVYFEYGTTTNYGFFSTSIVLTNNLNASQLVGIDVMNLTPGTVYHFQAIGMNSFGTNYGGDLTFTSSFTNLPPYAATLPATLVNGSSAQLNGMATPNGLPTTVWFQWGTNTLYGNQTPPVSVGSSFNVVYTTNQISGLLANVPYHFRLVVSNAQAVVYGFDQIFDQANVVVWGANYLGQASVPAGLSNVVAIAGAYDHSLALKNSGTVAAWGDNAFGQATVPAGLNNVVAVAGGEYYSMALKDNGTVAAWGATILGQTNVPAGLNNVVTIAGGTFSSLALQNDGTVVAWGASFFGLTNVPASLSNAVGIAGGSYHNLAIKNDGTVVAWGDNSVGQTAVPAGLTNVVAIAGGSYHSLALKYAGTVVAWGDNSAGQTSVPAGLSNVVAVAAGGFHSLALKNDGTVVAWGDNTAGQTSVPVGLSNVVAIASGYFHSLALTPLSNVNSTNPVVLNLTNGVAQTNSILPGGIVYYRVNVPMNADFATNILLFTLNGPLNIWFDMNTPPTTNVFLFSGTNGSYTLSTTGTPPLVPGSTYYLGVQNTNSFTVNYGIEVDFHLLTSTNAPIFISGITYTNIGGKFGFLLAWYAPTNDEFLVQWTGSLTPPITWNTFSNIVTYTGPPTPTNGLFTFFDDGSQFPFGPMRFYRLILLQSLTNGVPQTNSVPSGGMDYFLINVPTNADFATNLLLSATGPLNVWFNQATPPTGTNAGDYTLLAGATNGISILSTTSAPTNIVPGGTYWLGVQNTNGSAVTYGIEVDFHLLTPTNAPAGPIIITSITATNIGVTNGFLLQWQGPTNFQYEIQWTTNLAPVVWNTVLNPVINVVVTSTNGHYSFFDDGTLTGGFGPMKFYRVLGGLNLGPITGPGPATNTVLAGATSQAVVTVPANAISASNILISATGPLNVWFNQTNPPTGNTNAGDFLMLSATNAGTFVLTSNSVPPLVPGANYYLGIQNPGTNNVTFVFQVIFGFAPTNAVSNFSITATNIGVTNGFLLTWYAPTNDLFRVEWTDSLAPPAWNTFTNIIGYTGPVTPTNGLFSFFDDGSQSGGLGPMRFYRLILLQSTNVLTLPFQPGRIIDALTPLVVTNTATDSNTNATLSYVLTTSPPTGATIDTNGIITWTPSLAQAGTVNTFTTVVTDNSLPPISATNSFTVTVSALPVAISGITITTNGFFQLQWSAPTNYQFQVAWTTNLVSPVVWNYIPPTPPYITSITTNFTFVDTNAPTAMKFYRLLENP